ncbi:MAG: glutamine synthetase type III, partial [Saonia sp.]
YSVDWEKESKKRKLSNNQNTPEALQIMTSKESLELFKTMKVFSEVELRARQEVELEAYILHIQIEGRVLNGLVYNHILPSCLEYQHKLAENILGLKNIYGAGYKKMAVAQSAILEEIILHINGLKNECDAMTESRKSANTIKDTYKKSMAYCRNVKPLFEKIRYHSDRLERLVDDRLWPLTKYQELLFAK